MEARFPEKIILKLLATRFLIRIRQGLQGHRLPFGYITKETRTPGLLFKIKLIYQLSCGNIRKQKKPYYKFCEGFNCTSIILLVGVLLLSATLSIGTSTLVSGK